MKPSNYQVERDQRINKPLMLCESCVSDAINDAATDSTVSIIALTGKGDFYSSGNDLSGMLRVEDPKQAMEESRPKLKAVIEAFSACPKLLICVVNGPCIGIAATLAALCDIIYAADVVSIHGRLASRAY